MVDSYGLNPCINAVNFFLYRSQCYVILTFVGFLCEVLTYRLFHLLCWFLFVCVA